MVIIRTPSRSNKFVFLGVVADSSSYSINGQSFSSAYWTSSGFQGTNAQTEIFSVLNFTIVKLRVSIQANTKDGDSIWTVARVGVSIPDCEITMPAGIAGDFVLDGINVGIAENESFADLIETSASTSGSMSFLRHTGLGVTFG